MRRLRVTCTTSIHHHHHQQQQPAQLSSAQLVSPRLALPNTPEHNGGRPVVGLASARHRQVSRWAAYKWPVVGSNVQLDSERIGMKQV